MIILDNNILNSITRLNLFPLLNQLFPTVIISKKVLKEYSVHWKQNLPNWIKLKSEDEDITLNNVPSSLSEPDMSVIRLSIQLGKRIASDDKTLRNYAESIILEKLNFIPIKPQMKFI